MLTLLPRPFRHLLFEEHDNLNSLVNEIFESLALLMSNSESLVAAKKAILMLGPTPQEYDFRPLEDLHQDLGRIGPGFAALLENSLESGDLFIESPIQIDAYSPALRERLKPLQEAADKLSLLDLNYSVQAAQIVLTCLKTLYPQAQIADWLAARGCSDEIVRTYQ
ncbi:MAG: hypothetical protein V4534_03585 [Myxococcota bacterium]